MRPALTLVALALLPGVAFAQYEHLENPGTVSAVQERMYRMNHELNLGVGTLPLDAFYKGIAARVGYTFHFTDYFAWQVGRGLYTYNVDTGLREQLDRDFGVQPTAFEEVEWLVGSDLVWSPVYGKMALMNSTVMHFSVHFTAGASVLKVNEAFGGALGFAPAAAVGVGARLFKSDLISFRLDAMDNVAWVGRIVHVPTVFLSTSINFGATE